MTILEALIVSKIALTEQMTAEVEKGRAKYDGHKFATFQSAYKTIDKLAADIKKPN